ncbi:YrrS family protein [Planococcus sp. ISL-109]|uniref:YrrS family protein n=1 Tax=Planococcus sp. ISL-109 TaxID=2819166 RepID=UPI001BEAC22A|nr:YrrS family protein [Planococcus sp. ISL-109]MBT2582372.1 YrrS family protein [Planococcus sp. ISL-109]
MANKEQSYPSRLNKKKNNNNRSNSILNIMIALVFTLVIIIGATLLFGGDDDSADPESVEVAPETENQTSDKEDATVTAEENDLEEEQAEEDAQPEKDAAKEEEDKEKEEEEETKGGTITREDSNDPIVSETIVNTSWEPVGTSQSGDHVSSYQKDSVDWKEKIEAVAYATGLPQNDMYVMMVQNGGGPQKSIATVQSRDRSEKYRVFLAWADGEGWKPERMDVLKTLDGAY